MRNIWLASLTACLIPGEHFADPPVCAPSTSSCFADVTTMCDSNGQIARTEMCGFGCAPAGDVCWELDPSNQLAAALDGAAVAPAMTFDPTIDITTIDTDTGMVVHGGVALAIPSVVKIQPGLPDIRVLQMKSLVVQNPVTVTGQVALAIVSDGDVEIASTITLGGRSSSAGPGALVDINAECRGKDTQYVDTGSVAPGPGGAGFGAPGGDGGPADGILGQTGGGASGNEALEPLRGGCMGGDYRGHSGLAGGGGGALQISSRTRITVMAGGVIDVGGGGGITFLFPGGGGSGGGILLEAPMVNVAGILAANGGGGGCFFQSGEAGQIKYHANGLDNGLAAHGGFCNSESLGDGGGGGSKDNIAAFGGSATTTTSSRVTIGGGGGGAVGRIRVNTRMGGFTQRDSVSLVSPVASIGLARTR